MPRRLPERSGPLGLLLLLSSCLLVGPGAATADDADEAAAAEALVRKVYFEGLPYAEAKTVTAAGADRLIELLNDPNEIGIHARTLGALGMSARPGAYEAIVAYALEEPSGDLDSPGFHARVAIPLAMGHLARADPRALGWLVSRAEGHVGPPAWRFHSLEREQAAVFMRGRALVGLGLSGQPLAATVLKRIEAEGEPELRDHCREALELNTRIAAEGVDAVLGRRQQGVRR